MKMSYAGIAAAALLFAVPAAAQTRSQSASAAPADQSFITKAAGGGLGEVQLGELAQQKASSPDVKQFGQRMVQDHTQANEKLKAVLSSQGVTPPAKMDPESQRAYDRLSKLSGPAFDKAYIKDMVDDHQKDVKLFQDEATKGKDPAVKQFAQQTLPTLQEHLQMAQKIEAQHR